MAYKRALSVSFLIAIACVGYGCPSGSTAPTGEVLAVVDGVAYTGKQTTARINNLSLEVASENTPVTLEVNFASPMTVGVTHTIGLGIPLSFQIETSSGGIWNATQGLGSGSLYISAIDANGAVGIFNCICVPTSGGAVGNKVVTNGSFNVKF